MEQAILEAITKTLPEKEVGLIREVFTKYEQAKLDLSDAIAIKEELKKRVKDLADALLEKEAKLSEYNTREYQLAELAKNSMRRS